MSRFHESLHRLVTAQGNGLRVEIRKANTLPGLTGPVWTLTATESAPIGAETIRLEHRIGSGQNRIGGAVFAGTAVEIGSTQHIVSADAAADLETDHVLELEIVPGLATDLEAGAEVRIGGYATAMAKRQLTDPSAEDDLCLVKGWGAQLQALHGGLGFSVTVAGDLPWAPRPGDKVQISDGRRGNVVASEQTPGGWKLEVEQGK